MSDAIEIYNRELSASEKDEAYLLAVFISSGGKQSEMPEWYGQLQLARSCGMSVHELFSWPLEYALRRGRIASEAHNIAVRMATMAAREKIYG